MQRFYHNDQQQLTQLLEAFSEASGKYSRKDFDTERTLKLLLDKIIARYKEGGHTDRESQAQLLRAELATAERGIHPQTHERVTLRKSDMKTGVQLKVLQTLEHLLRDEYAAGNVKLQEAREVMVQIMLAGLQHGILNDAILAGANTEAALQGIWKALSADSNIALAQKRVLMTVSMYDALIILEALAAQMKHD
ncbi:hypothetical protein EGT74_13220 [Chitinophaga lutea]|uniref:Uncharacterized protein n=1 Tax=Chitinophaga lutea TaxID=2488634 RepID=A0A3N4PN08_9BACT|nr:hypothetical protein [Chitinophaga lutea]RPE08029.1 hypothetical protein EGT74_13220 [Chitinophaga lutea]